MINLRRETGQQQEERRIPNIETEAMSDYLLTPEKKLRLTQVGSVNLGMGMFSLTFDSSPLVESSCRTMVGLALQVAFYGSGCTHMQYYRILQQFLESQQLHVNHFMI